MAVRNHRGALAGLVENPSSLAWRQQLQELEACAALLTVPELYQYSVSGNGTGLTGLYLLLDRKPTPSDSDWVACFVERVPLPFERKPAVALLAEVVRNHLPERRGSRSRLPSPPDPARRSSVAGLVTVLHCLQLQKCMCLLKLLT